MPKGRKKGLVLTDPAMKTIKRLRRKIKAKDDAEVVRRALRLYDHFFGGGRRSLFNKGK